MTEVKIFNHPIFGEVRTAGMPMGPLFCFADVCRALELDSIQVVRRLDIRVATIHLIRDRSGCEQLACFVNEEGLYDVIIDSRKPEARAFYEWVTSEVLNNKEYVEV